MKNRILNANAKYMLARLGHRDYLAVTDACFNIPKDIQTVDLAVLPDVPTIMQVIDGILSEVVVEEVILAEEIKTQAPDILLEYEKRFPAAVFVFMPHTPDFDDFMHNVKGAIRTGQYRYHAPNCILKIGCEY